MSIPCNRVDYERFKKLADLLANQLPPVEMRIYVGGDSREPSGYVSLELKGKVSRDLIDEVFGVKSPSPSDASVIEYVDGYQANIAFSEM